MAIVTPESVAAACEAIEAEGERPTVARVTAKLGGGSPNKILPLLNAWRDAKRQGAGTASPPPAEDSVGAEVITEEMDHAAETLKRGFLAVLTTFVEQERSRAASAQQAIQSAAEQKMALVRAAADQQVSDMAEQARGDVDEARAEAQAQAEQVEALTVERDELTARIVGLLGDRDQTAKVLAEEQAAHQAARGETDRLGTEVEAFRRAVMQADARAAAAERAQDQAVEAQRAAEGRSRAADDARQVADGERRQVLAQARAREAEDLARIDALVGERSQLLQELAATTAAAEAAHRELVARFEAAEATGQAQTVRIEGLLRELPAGPAPVVVGEAPLRRSSPVNGRRRRGAEGVA